MINREATRKDAKIIEKMMTALHKESRYKRFPIKKEKLFAFINNMISSDTSLVMLATEEKGIIGIFIANISSMYFSDCTVASDYYFYVSPKHRKNGVGTKLLDSYINWAKEKKVNDIALSTSTGISDEAIKKLAGKYEMVKVGLSYRMVNHV
ncbi:MAG: GNAT family N-acetyltransferase [Nitrosomonadaceae bacterium]